MHELNDTPRKLSDSNATAAYSVAIRGFERARLNDLYSPISRRYGDDINDDREEVENSPY